MIQKGNVRSKGYCVTVGKRHPRSLRLPLPEVRRGGVRSFSKWSLGFSLVELIAVLVLLAMTASILSLRYATPLRRARLETAVQQWLSIDQFARQHCRTNSFEISFPANDRSKVVLKRRDSEEIFREWDIDSRVLLTVEATSKEPLDRVAYFKGVGSIDYRVVLSDTPFSETIEIAGGTGLASRNHAH